MHATSLFQIDAALSFQTVHKTFTPLGKRNTARRVTRSAQRSHCGAAMQAPRCLAPSATALHRPPPQVPARCLALPRHSRPACLQLRQRAAPAWTRLTTSPVCLASDQAQQSSTSPQVGLAHGRQSAQLCLLFLYASHAWRQQPSSSLRWLRVVPCCLGRTFV